MTDQLHMTKTLQSDDEEEDLELLRLEALKTIHAKKETINPQIPSYHHHQSRSIRISTTNPYKITHQHVTPIDAYPKNNLLNDNYNSGAYYPPLPHSDNNLPVTRPLTNHLNSYDARQRLEKLDINEPYVPQRVAAINPSITAGPIATPTTENWVTESNMLMGNGYVPYIPRKTTENIRSVGNIQLSPRSMAFVAENNDILMRRKGEKSSHEPAYLPISPTSSPYYRSSPYCPRSPSYRSPVPYRSSPGRWSPSSSVKSKSHSPILRNRQHSSYAHRRSSSRSPPSSQRSPAFRRKTLSKSPMRTSRHPSPYYRYQSKSPPSSNFRRGKSKSPLPNLRHKVSPRPTSRSPNPAGRYIRQVSRSPPLPNTNGRRRSPQVVSRYTNRSRANSPLQLKRSPGSRAPDLVDFNKYSVRRSRSPVNQSGSVNHLHRKSPSPRARSRSRSPFRKNQRRSRERNTQIISRRRSPYDRHARRRNDGPMNGVRNRNRKRSGSPMNSRKKRSRTKSPERTRRDENRSRKFDRDRRRLEDNVRNERFEERGKSLEDKYKNNQTSTNKRDGQASVDRKSNKNESKETKMENKDDKVFNKNERTNKVERNDNKSKNEETNINASLTPIKETKEEYEETKEKREKSDKEAQVKTSSSNVNDDDDENEKDEDDSSDDDDNDDDRIDLFASDESESENEGRFKLSSSKNERNTRVPILSFSKLNESSIPSVVKDLQEVTTSTFKNDRDNKSGNRSTDFENRRRDDKFKKSSSDSLKNHRSDRRRNNVKNGSRSNSNSNSRDRRDRDETKTNKAEEKKSEENKPMFKSTFTVVESEVIKTNGKICSDKDSIEKKSTVQLKRKFQSKVDKDSSETEIQLSSPSDNKLTSVVGVGGGGNISSSLVSLTTTSPSAGSGKKPIHMRLGAMTNTFKSPKKSTNWTTVATSSSSSPSEKV